jgi:hypothetical protein
MQVQEVCIYNYNKSIQCKRIIVQDIHCTEVYMHTKYYAHMYKQPLSLLLTINKRIITH